MLEIFTARNTHSDYRMRRRPGTGVPFDTIRYRWV